jgi:hypothetical protein
LVSQSGEIILPMTWESLIEPGWTITMHLWPAGAGQQEILTTQMKGLGFLVEAEAGKSTVPLKVVPASPALKNVANVANQRMKPQPVFNGTENGAGSSEIVKSPTEDDGLSRAERKRKKITEHLETYQKLNFKPVFGAGPSRK